MAGRSMLCPTPRVRCASLHPLAPPEPILFLNCPPTTHYLHSLSSSTSNCTPLPTFGICLQTSLCVRRAVYWDPEAGAEDPAKKGICSNFLCDAKPGDEITMTGVQPSQPTTMWPSLPPWAINLVECSQYLMGVKMR